MGWRMNISHEVIAEQNEEEEVVGISCNRTQLLIFLPLVQTVFSLIYIFIGVCGFLGNSLIVLAAVRSVVSFGNSLIVLAAVRSVVSLATVLLSSLLSFLWVPWQQSYCARQVYGFFWQQSHCPRCCQVCGFLGNSLIVLAAVRSVVSFGNSLIVLFALRSAAS